MREVKRQRQKRSRDADVARPSESLRAQLSGSLSTHMLSRAWRQPRHLVVCMAIGLGAYTWIRSRSAQSDLPGWHKLNRDFEQPLTTSPPVPVRPVLSDESLEQWFAHGIPCIVEPFPIDASWLWVNGTDPTWLKVKEKMAIAEGAFSPGHHYR